MDRGPEFWLLASLGGEPMNAQSKLTRLWVSVTPKQLHTWSSPV